MRADFSAPGEGGPLKMKPMRNAWGRENLAWKSVGWQGLEFHLQADDDLFAILRLVKVPTRVRFVKTVSPEAQAEDGKWTFKGGLSVPGRITVHEIESGRDIGELKLKIGGGGDLELYNGRTFRWKITGLEPRKGMFMTFGDEPLVTFKGSWPKPAWAGSRVEIEQAAVSIPELSLLVVLGWYTVHQEHI